MRLFADGAEYIDTLQEVEEPSWKFSGRHYMKIWDSKLLRLQLSMARGKLETCTTKGHFAFSSVCLKSLATLAPASLPSVAAPSAGLKVSVRRSRVSDSSVVCDHSPCLA